MPIHFVKTELEGLIVIESDIFEDERGFFRELYHRETYRELGEVFVQDNHSHSKKGVLRGLHYQLNTPQGKLVTAVTGEIFDVAVDIRKGSPTFGKWFSAHLSPMNKRQIYIPGGFAHGFYVLSHTADVLYKCTDFYNKQDEYGLHWSDKTVGVNWPVSDPVVSEKDSGLPTLENISKENLPEYRK